jgi:hypothetical protein
MQPPSHQKVVAFTIAAGLRIARLEGSRSTKTPVGTEAARIIAASAGVATPPAVNSTTGELATGARDLQHEFVRCL